MAHFLFVLLCILPFSSGILIPIGLNSGPFGPVLEFQQPPNAVFTSLDLLGLSADDVLQHGQLANLSWQEDSLFDPEEQQLDLQHLWNDWRDAVDAIDPKVVASMTVQGPGLHTEISIPISRGTTGLQVLEIVSQQLQVPLSSLRLLLDGQAANGGMRLYEGLSDGAQMDVMFEQFGGGRTKGALNKPKPPPKSTNTLTSMFSKSKLSEEEKKKQAEEEFARIAVEAKKRKAEEEAAEQKVAKIRKTKKEDAAYEKDLISQGLPREVVSTQTALRRKSRKDTRKAEALRERSKAPGIWELSVTQRGTVQSFIENNPRANAEAVIRHFWNYHRDIYPLLHVKTIQRWIARARQPVAGCKQAPGRKPLFRSEFLSNVLSGARDLISLGSPMNSIIFRGIVIAEIEILRADGSPKWPALLHRWQSGGLMLSQSWCRKCMFRFFLTSRRPTGTKEVTVDSEDSKQLIDRMAARLAILVAEHSIPRESVFHWDQTGLTLLSIGRTTRAAQGLKHIHTIGFGEKRQVTGNPLLTMAGSLISYQLLFQGKTEGCRPPNWRDFDNDVDLLRPRHTPSHWTSVEVQQDLLLDAEQTLLLRSESLKFPYAQQAFVLLIDVYSSHTCLEFITWFKDRYDGNSHPKGFLLFVPAGLTGQCQPADLTVQSKTKTILREQGSLHIAKSLRDTRNLNMRMSFLKPLLLQWMKVVTHFFVSPDGAALIRKGFELAGLERAYDPEFQAAAKLMEEDLFPSVVDPSVVPPGPGPAPHPLRVLFDDDDDPVLVDAEDEDPVVSDIESDSSDSSDHNLAPSAPAAPSSGVVMPVCALCAAVGDGMTEEQRRKIEDHRLEILLDVSYCRGCHQHWCVTKAEWACSTCAHWTCRDHFSDFDEGFCFGCSDDAPLEDDA